MIDPELRETINKVVERLDDQVLLTPTGDVRNLLTDAAIVIQALLETSSSMSAPDASVSKEQVGKALSEMDEGFAPALQDQAKHWTWSIKSIEEDEDVRVAHCEVVLVFEDVAVKL